MFSKTTMRYHFTPFRKASFKKTRNHEFWEGCEEKGTLPYAVGGNVNVTVTMENNGGSSKI